MSSGARPATAIRVKGTVSENDATPSRPHQSPDDNAAARGAVTLLSTDMSNDSSARIVAGLRAWIAQATPGTRVPSNRALMAQYGASPVTVQKAMRALGALGLVESRPGVGTFVRALRTARAPDYGWQTAALGAPRARIPTLSSALR
jgi:hypothetical protein